MKAHERDPRQLGWLSILSQLLLVCAPYFEEATFLLSILSQLLPTYGRAALRSTTSAFNSFSVATLVEELTEEVRKIELSILSQLLRSGGAAAIWRGAATLSILSQLLRLARVC